MFPNEIICLILDFCQPHQNLTKLDHGFEIYLYNKPEYQILLERDIIRSVAIHKPQRFFTLIPLLKTFSAIIDDLLIESIRLNRFDVFDRLLSDFRLSEMDLKSYNVINLIFEKDLLPFFKRLFQWKPPRGYKKYHKLSGKLQPKEIDWIDLAILYNSFEILLYLISTFASKENESKLLKYLSKCCRLQNLAMLDQFLKSFDWTKKCIKMCINEYCLLMKMTTIFPSLISSKTFGPKYYRHLITESVKSKNYEIFDYIYLHYVKNHPEVLENAVKSLIKHPNLNSLKLMIYNGLSPSWNNNWLVQKCSQYGLADFVEYLTQFEDINVIANNSFALRKAKGSGYDDIVLLLQSHHSFQRFLLDRSSIIY